MKTLESEFDPQLFSIIEVLNRKLYSKESSSEDYVFQLEELSENLLNYYKNAKELNPEIDDEIITIHTYSTFINSYEQAINYYPLNKEIN